MSISASVRTDRPSRETEDARPEGPRRALERLALERHARARPEIEPPFVGRTAELVALRRGLQRTLRGLGSLWVVTGAPGIGKTRLLGELAAVGRQGGFRVYERLSSWEGQDPLLPWMGLLAPWIDATVGPHRGESTSEARRGRRPRRGGRSPDLTALEILDALEVASTVSPLLILIDDLHRSDTYSIRFLRLLGRQIATRRIMVVVTGRSEPSTPYPPRARLLAEVTEELRIAGRLHDLELGGLGEDAAVRLVTEVLRDLRPARRWSVAQLASLTRVADGNPYFLRELATNIAAESRSLRGPADDERRLGVGARGLPELPGTLEDAIRVRLEQLPSDDRKLLAVAAAVGVAFRVEDLAVALGRRAGPLRWELDHGSLGKWPLRRGDLDPGAYTFRHPLLRRVAVELVSPAQRRRFAAQLAQVWSVRHPDDLAALARFYSESDQPTAGRAIVDRLIARSIHQHEYGSLEQLLSWKQAVEGGGARGHQNFRASLLRTLRALRPDSPLEIAPLCLRYLDLSPPEPDRSIVEAWYIYDLLFVDRPLAARRLERLREHLLGPTGRPHPEARLALEHCEVALHLARGEFDAARSILRKRIDHLRDQGAAFERMLLVRAWVTICLHSDRLAEAGRWVRAGQRIARRAGLGGSATALGLIEVQAAIQHHRGNLRRAARIAAAVARRCTELGAIPRATRIWHNVGASHVMLGDFSRARDAYGEELRLARRWGLTGAEGSALACLGECELADGRPNEAEPYYRRALPLLETAPHSEAFAVVARTGLADILVEQGRLDDAEDQVRQAETQSRHSFEWTVLQVNQVKALVIERRGNVPAARRLLRRSLARTSEPTLRFVRLELLAALARLERRAGRPEAAAAWERRARVEAARTHRTGRLESLLRARPGRADPATGRGRGPPAVSPRLVPSGSVAHRTLATFDRVGAIAGGALDAEVVPPSFTQAGVAHELGLPRESIVRTLHRLVDRGMLVEVRRRVEGAPRTQKVYLLTPRGRRSIGR